MIRLSWSIMQNVILGNLKTLLKNIITFDFFWAEINSFWHSEKKHLNIVHELNWNILFCGMQCFQCFWGHFSQDELNSSKNFLYTLQSCPYSLHNYSYFKNKSGLLKLSTTPYFQISKWAQSIVSIVYYNTKYHN